MQNSEEIRQAIRSYLDENGRTAVELAEKLGVAHTTVGRWLSGKALTIRPKHWADLRNLISPYLSGEYAPIADGPEQSGLGELDRMILAEFQQLNAEQKRKLLRFAMKLADEN